MGHGTSLNSCTHLLSKLSPYLFLIGCVLTGNCVARYEWKTGLFSECMHNTCGRGGSQFRSVFCGEEGDDNLHVVDESKCSELQKPKNMRECFKACEEHRQQLLWAKTVWSDCQLQPEYRECSIKNGIRYRNVTCEWRSNGLVEDDTVCSEFQPKPDIYEQCDLKCPQDCVVSAFSSWNNSNCDNCIIVNKTRTRELIVPPSNGGSTCPSFTEMQSCDNCIGTYTYKISPWDECSSLFEDKVQNKGQVYPLLGSQTRNIQCINSFGLVVPIIHCKEHLQSMVTELVLSRTCIIPQDCTVSAWSAWSLFNTSCVQADGKLQQGYLVRSHSVLQIPLGPGKPCPPLVQFVQLKSEREQQCARTTWKMSAWNDCEVPAGSYGCTTGLQTRMAICVQLTDDGKEKPVQDYLCKDKQPLTSQVCQALCDIDCSVSMWTTWTECKVTDCELYERRRRTNEGTGQRYRTRLVYTEPRGNGNACPHLSETQTCDPQPCYSWSMTLAPCNLLDSNAVPQCGLGIAYRTVACVNKLNLRVADTNCEELSERPSIQEDCYIPCPGDCILSPWSDWSPCPNLCQDGQSRAGIQTRERTILAMSGPGRAPCPTNHQLEEVQTCPASIECSAYKWQADQWGVCTIKEPGTRCGPGFQTRDVSCYSLQGLLVSDQRCTIKVKPKKIQNCTIQCPVNCELTDFSDWSICSASCWEATQTVPIQTRKRFIVQDSRHGGTPCPDKLTEIKPCSNLTICVSFYWDTGAWSKCVLPLHKVPQCGQGLQSRNISCKSENGTLQPLDICLRNIGPNPAISKPCYKSCNEECKFDDWSDWSKCVNGCHGNRFRTRKLIDDDKNNRAGQHCRDTRFYPLDSFEKCLCDKHKVVSIGNWSECILEPDNTYHRSSRFFQGYTLESPRSDPADVLPTTGVGVNAICGQGHRYKVLSCQNEKGETEAASKCSKKPYEEEKCLIPCPVDCVMSDWSQWTDCSTSCGKGTQIRYRHIKQHPNDGGRLCPSLDNTGKDTQTRICKTDCHMCIWHPTTWSTCMPTQHEAVCGNGTQLKNVRCEIFTADGFLDDLCENYLCFNNMNNKPIDQRQCYSPCVGECVVSEWTSWSRCKQPCADPNQVQTRSRFILRQPSEDPIFRCPHLLEEKFCVRGDNCLEYSWKYIDWTTCLVNNGQDECGIGHEERFPVCMDSNSQIVEDDFCLQAIGESMDQKVKSCQIPCDVDCLLTEWTPWSGCSSTCGLGEQTSTRDVIQKQKGHGRKCPTVFEQHKPCFLKGCYQWNISPWSVCMYQKGVCGAGIQSRNITCTTDDGVSVNATNCAPDLDIIILIKERPCTIPCPGECVISEWTVWSSCFIDCKNFERARYMSGVQSRSRAVLANAELTSPPCPEQLWESRSCEASQCYMFYWKTSDWTAEKTRNIWCERTDGIVVTGGCPNSSKPATELSCQPECFIPHSYCNDTNICLCVPFYQPVFNRLNTLTECKMSNYTESTTIAKPISLPIDGPTNIWMYAIIATATLIVIFLAVACYTMSEFFHKGPRPRKKDLDVLAEGADEVDKGMAETTFSCCNNVPVNNVTVDCVTRADVPSGVRALACNDFANAQLSTAQPFCVSSAACNNGVSVTHDSPQFCITQPPSSCLSVDTFQNRVISVHVSSKADLHCNSATADLEETKTETLGHNNKSYSLSKNFLSILKKMNPLRKSAKNDDNVRSSLLSWKKCPVIQPDALQNRHNKMICQENVVLSSFKQVCNSQQENGNNAQVDHSNVNMKYGVETDDAISKIKVIGNRETLRDIEVAVDASKRNNCSSHLCSAVERLNKTDSCDDDALLLDTANETDTLLSGSKDRILDRNPVVKDKVLVNKRPVSDIRPSAILSFKSRSLEQTERSLNSSVDLSKSDDSMGRTHSLRSQSSIMSRHSQLSHLSVSKGPQINIDPVDVHSDSKKRSLPSGFKLRRKANIGYATYSSLDTETSTAPSSSCDSLSPRSQPPEPHTYPGRKLQDRSQGTGEIALHKNVALDSLKQNRRQKTQRALDKDSGVDSMPLNINVSHITNRSPATNEIIGNSVPVVNITKAALNWRSKEYLNDKVKLNENKHSEDKYEDVVQGKDVQLLTPMDFVRNKKCTLIKQDCNEVDILDEMEIRHEDDIPDELYMSDEQIDC